MSRKVNDSQKLNFTVSNSVKNHLRVMKEDYVQNFWISILVVEVLSLVVTYNIWIWVIKEIKVDFIDSLKDLVRNFKVNENSKLIFCIIFVGTFLMKKVLGIEGYFRALSVEIADFLKIIKNIKVEKQIVQVVHLVIDILDIVIEKNFAKTRKIFIVETNKGWDIKNFKLLKITDLNIKNLNSIVLKSFGHGKF